LKEKRALNALSDNETRNIWTPEVIFSNREPYPYVVNIKEKITVIRNLSHVADTSDISLLHAAYIYSGHHHPLRMFTEIR
jgi:hypothetical protein